MYTKEHRYKQDKTNLHGYCAYDDSVDGKRPAILVAPDWTGRNEFACKRAELLAEMGYVGFALDMYGEGKSGSNDDEKMALIKPLLEDRLLLRNRMLAALDAVSSLPQVDTSKIGVIGFCFGGLCALDLARSGVDIKAAVSFHGLLNKPEHLAHEKIKAKILVLHGFADPSVPPNQVLGFCQEMDEAGVDWQVDMYGHVQHAFTNPLAKDPHMGRVYDAVADTRSWKAMTNFFEEIFA